jgi:hypothetical protein
LVDVGRHIRLADGPVRTGRIESASFTAVRGASRLTLLR